MKNEELSMEELLQLLVKSSNQMQQQLVGLEIRLNNRIDSLKEETNQRFDWIENNMATKSQVYRLIDVLRNRQMISEFDANYAMDSQALS